MATPNDPLPCGCSSEATGEHSPSCAKLVATAIIEQRPGARVLGHIQGLAATDGDDCVVAMSAQAA